MDIESRNSGMAELSQSGGRQNVRCNYVNKPAAMYLLFPSERLNSNGRIGFFFYEKKPQNNKIKITGRALGTIIGKKILDGIIQSFHHLNQQIVQHYSDN